MGPYKDEILCDVLDMKACHLLLGKQWQVDRDVCYKESKNAYDFTFHGKKIRLTSIPQSEITLSKEKRPQLAMIGRSEFMQDLHEEIVVGEDFSIPLVIQDEECAEEACGMDIIEVECVQNEIQEDEGIQGVFDGDHIQEKVQEVEMGKDALGEGIVRLKMRKFEAFETLFDPPKFLPYFMMVDDSLDVFSMDMVEVSTMVYDGVLKQEGVFHRKVKSHAVHVISLSKIRGRIFSRKGSMGYIGYVRGLKTRFLVYVSLSNIWIWLSLWRSLTYNLCWAIWGCRGAVMLSTSRHSDSFRFEDKSS